MTIRTMRLPDFVGIGAQKAGTTSLHYLLAQDQRIGVPQCKEVHFFDSDNWKDTRKYSHYFENLSNSKVIGEITPYSMFHPEAARRIHKTIPEAKIIAVLRDPIKRAISQYFHARRRGYEQLSIDDAIDKENERLASGSKYSHQKHSYISRSRYADQLLRYEKLFPSSNILLLKSEDMFIDAERTWMELQKFLGLEAKPLKSAMPKANSGKGESRDISDETRNKIKLLLKDTYTTMKQKYGMDWSTED